MCQVDFESASRLALGLWAGRRSAPKKVFVAKLLVCSTLEAPNDEAARLAVALSFVSGYNHVELSVFGLFPRMFWVGREATEAHPKLKIYVGAVLLRHALRCPYPAYCGRHSRDCGGAGMVGEPSLHVCESALASTQLRSGNDLRTTGKQPQTGAASTTCRGWSQLTISKSLSSVCPESTSLRICCSALSSILLRSACSTILPGCWASELGTLPRSVEVIALGIVHVDLRPMCSGGAAEADVGWWQSSARTPSLDPHGLGENFITCYGDFRTCMSRAQPPACKMLEIPVHSFRTLVQLYLHESCS